MRNYTRWTRRGGKLQADILGAVYTVEADPGTGNVALTLRQASIFLSPDEARMLGVRLVEGAALADGDRAIRDAPSGGLT